MAACGPHPYAHDTTPRPWPLMPAPGSRKTTSRRKTTMPLRVELKPFERIVIGESVIINSGTRTCFLIDGDTPILREKDTVTAESADTPAKRLYLCVQTMYLKNDATRQRERYLDLIKELRDTIPHSRDLIESVETFR